MAAAASKATGDADPRICEISKTAPYLVRQFDDYAQLGPLFIFRQNISLLGRGKAALRRQAKLIKRDKFRRFINAAFDVVFRLEPAALRCNEAEDKLLLALGEIAQRLETAGAITIVFQEIAIEVGFAEQLFGHETVAAFGDPGGTKLAAARMHGDRHIRRFAFERRIGHARVDRGQLVRIVAALARLLALFEIAHHRPGSIVELQVAATGIVERADRLAPGVSDIGKEDIDIRIGLLAHHRPALTEMKCARRRDGHLRRDAAMRLQKLEVFKMRMAGKINLAVDADRLVLGLHAAKLDSGGGGDRRHSGQPAKEIEMPPRSAKFAVCRKLEPDVFLFPDDLFYFAIFDRLQRRGVDFVFRSLAAR